MDVPEYKVIVTGNVPVMVVGSPSVQDNGAILFLLKEDGGQRVPAFIFAPGTWLRAEIINANNNSTHSKSSKRNDSGSV